MAVIGYVIRGGQKSWIASYNGKPNPDGTGTAALRFTSLIADAAEFTDQAAVLTFLNGKDAATVANGQLFTQTAGIVNYGRGEH
jgi:hypothetical protein